METGKAEDLEDLDLTDKMKLIGYNENEFMNLDSSGYITLTYRVEDQYGKEAYLSFHVVVADAGDTVDIQNVTYVRFIDLENYEKNRNNATATYTEAEAIRLVYEAEANGLRLLNEAKVSENVLALKKLDALKKMGDGRATKIIVPTDLASAASSLHFVSEMLGIPGAEIIDKSEKVVTETIKEDPCCE